MNKYPHLFEPIQIGTQTVKNRVFMPPISTNLANSVSDVPFLGQGIYYDGEETQAIRMAA